MTMTFEPIAAADSPSEAAAPEEIAMSQAAENPSQKGAREEKVRAMLRRFFRTFQVLMYSRQARDTFLEMDLIAVLDAGTQVLQSKFSLRVTFRQLLDAQSSLLMRCHLYRRKNFSGLYEEAVPAATQVQAAAASVAASPISFAPAAPNGQELLLRAG